MDNLLSLIGLAKRAGRLEIGEAPVGAAARAKKAKLLLLASDAAENSQRRAGHFAEQGNCPLLTLPNTKAELGKALGRTSCAMLALTDVGLAASMTKKLAMLNPETYGETSEKLEVKAARAQARLKEKLAHDKKVSAHIKNPWAPPTASPKKSFPKK